MLPRQREVTLFLSITYHKNLTSVYLFLFRRTLYRKIVFSSLILTYSLDSEDKKNICLPSLSPFFLEHIYQNRLARPFGIQNCPAKSVNS